MKHDPDFMEKITQDLEARKAAARILNVGVMADSNELKKAYRKTATEHHPDHNGNTPEANKKFILIKCAYDLLAFDKFNDKLLQEINTWPGVPEDNKYNLDNPWGHFLWWREKFYASEIKNERSNEKKRSSCI
ncbi:MAG: J domain-containing protein [Sedimentisphaerales bacterium]|nr:J domain-containing protein [Sedimentisphaerales bacterium]